MALIQWREAFEPFRDLRELQDRMSRLFDVGIDRGTSTFPPVDVRQDGENVYLVAELPGVTLDGLEVTVTGDTLSIKGERKPAEAKDEKFHRRERSFGHFARLVSLPDRVDGDRIQATLKDGILRVTLPKAESAKPRQIKVAQA